MKEIELFEADVEALRLKYHIQGLVVALGENDKIIYEKSFGYKDVENKEPPSIDTVFGIASLTKSFTCLGIMQLVEAGKIDLKAPVVDYIPQFSISDQKALNEMTVHHFMTHSSALPPLPSIEYAMERDWNPSGMVDYKETMDEDIELKNYADLLNFIAQANVKLLGQVGSVFSYSNDAYGLLGLVIENASGMTYEQYLEEYIFKPCGLKQTHFLIEDYENKENLTTCYEVNDQVTPVVVYKVNDWWDAPAMRATGFLKSSAKDMLQYSKLFMHDGVVDGQRIVTADSIAQMKTRHIKMDPLNDYGYGFSLPHDYFGKTLIEHGGSLQSVSAKFAVIPEDNLSAIVLANTTDFPASKVLRSLLNSYYQRPLDASPIDFKDYELSEENLASYLGDYSSGEGMTVTLKMQNNEIAFYYMGEAYPIKFINDKVFLADIEDGVEPGEIFFDQEHKPKGLSLYHRILSKENT